MRGETLACELVEVEVVQPSSQRTLIRGRRERLQFFKPLIRQRIVVLVASSIILRKQNSIVSYVVPTMAQIPCALHGSNIEQVEFYLTAD